MDFSLHGDKFTSGYLSGTFFGLADSGLSVPTGVYLTAYPYYNQFTPFSEYISGPDFITSGTFDIEGSEIESSNFSFTDSANGDNLTIQTGDPTTKQDQKFEGEFQGFSFQGPSVGGGGVDLSVSSAPEPSTWTLLITGLAGLGVLLRQRSRDRLKTV